MADLIKSRITLVWALLVVVTCLSWSSTQGSGWLSDPRIATSLVMLIAFLKVRYILLEFMETREAPLWLRVTCEAWVVVVCAAIIAMRWLL
jgi:Prokaryotic Cytochrome C oxidase subunit IV